MSFILGNTPSQYGVRAILDGNLLNTDWLLADLSLYWTAVATPIPRHTINLILREAKKL